MKNEATNKDWIPANDTSRTPDAGKDCWVTTEDGGVYSARYYNTGWSITLKVIAWRPIEDRPQPYRDSVVKMGDVMKSKTSSLEVIVTHDVKPGDTTRFSGTVLVSGYLSRILYEKGYSASWWLGNFSPAPKTVIKAGTVMRSRFWELEVVVTHDVMEGDAQFTGVYVPTHNTVRNNIFFRSTWETKSFRPVRSEDTTPADPAI